MAGRTFVDALDAKADALPDSPIRTESRPTRWVDALWAMSLDALAGTDGASIDTATPLLTVFLDAADAARSGLQTFDADSGFKDLGLNLTASFKPWEHWGLMGLVSYKRLLDDAEDSPVVDDEGDANQLMGGILVTYTF